jgi:hypothetical protein
MQTHKIPLELLSLVTGFADDSVALAQSITWKKSEVTTVSVTPGSYTAALKSTNSVSVTVLDQFLAPMAGVVLRPSYGATTTATLSSSSSSNHHHWILMELQHTHGQMQVLLRSDADTHSHL